MKQVRKWESEKAGWARVGVLQLARLSTTRSPSPQPSPAGRGRLSVSARSAVASPLTGCGMRFSLSRRERVGVRGKGLPASLQPHLAISLPVTFSLSRFPTFPLSPLPTR